MHANHKALTAARSRLGITLNWLLEPVCFLCEESSEWRNGLCGICQTTSMAYDRIIAPTVYRHSIDQMLYSLEYAGRLQWARTAAGLIVD